MMRSTPWTGDSGHMVRGLPWDGQRQNLQNYGSRAFRVEGIGHGVT